MTADEASQYYRELCARPFDSFVPGAEMQAVVDAIVARYQAAVNTNDDPWAAEPDVGDDVALMAIQTPLAAIVAPIVEDEARARHLVCFDPQSNSVLEPSPDYDHVVTLELANGRVIKNPNPDQIDQSVRRLSRTNWFAIIERGHNFYVQIGYGDNAGAPPGQYVLEYRDGSPERHWRTITPSMHESIAALQDYLQGSMNWTRKFTWKSAGAEVN